MDCPFIYALIINGYIIYIGKTFDPKRRENQHFSICYNENSPEYEKKRYQTIRQIGIDKEQYNQYVKLVVLYSDVPLEYQSMMEDLVINLYREAGFNITNELQGVDYSICEHDRQKAQCKDCNGSGICEHNRRRDRCKECGGSGICEHDKNIYSCKDCSPVLCVCGKTYSKGTYKRHLKICSSSLSSICSSTT